MKYKYIAILCNSAWGLVKESRGYIFRRCDNDHYGINGYWDSEQKAIDSVIGIGGIVINTETNLVCKVVDIAE